MDPEGAEIDIIPIPVAAIILLITLIKYSLDKSPLGAFLSKSSLSALFVATGYLRLGHADVSLYSWYVITKSDETKKDFFIHFWKFITFLINHSLLLHGKAKRQVS